MTPPPHETRIRRRLTIIAWATSILAAIALTGVGTGTYYVFAVSDALNDIESEAFSECISDPDTEASECEGL